MAGLVARQGEARVLWDVSAGWAEAGSRRGAAGEEFFGEVAGGEIGAEAGGVDIDQADSGGRKFARGSASEAGEPAAPGAVVVRLEEPACVLEQDERAAVGFKVRGDGFQRGDGVRVQGLTRTGEAVGKDQGAGLAGWSGDGAHLKT